MQLKKIGHIILVLLLLISTAGVSINKHYSGGELFSKSIFFKAKSCCETPCGCCNETSKFVQVKADYLSSAFHLEQVQQLDLYLFDFGAVLNHLSLANCDLPVANVWDTSPPSTPDLCILNQVFRL